MILLLALLGLACQSLPPRLTGDLAGLQGHWRGQGPGGGCTITIVDDGLRFQAREDFWFETKFILPAAEGPKQLHATIVEESSPDGRNIGTVVVAIFKLESDGLELGVVDDFPAPLTSPVVGDWERVMDFYSLERAHSND